MIKLRSVFDIIENIYGFHYNSCIDNVNRGFIYAYTMGRAIIIIRRER